MKRIAIVVVVLAVVLPPGLALAEWSWRWDMPLDDVARALGVSPASATPVDDSQQLKGPYTSGDHRFEGTFTFEHSKLRGVSLSAVDPAQCSSIRRSLDTDYGKPDTNKETPGVMTMTTWRTAKDQIVWMRVVGSSDSQSCLVVYSPRSGSDEKRR